MDSRNRHANLCCQTPRGQEVPPRKAGELPESPPPLPEATPWLLGGLMCPPGAEDAALNPELGLWLQPGSGRRLLRRRGKSDSMFADRAGNLSLEKWDFFFFFFSSRKKKTHPKQILVFQSNSPVLLAKFFSTSQKGLRPAGMPPSRILFDVVILNLQT